MKEPDVRTRFLDAAEAEFAATGYGGTRTRSIAELAGARIGTLHHYWKSKQELFLAICRRRFDPIANEGIRRLDAVEVRLDAGQPVSVGDLLHAVIDPQFASPDDDTMRAAEIAAFHALYSRTVTDPAPEARAVMEEIFGEPARQFILLLRRIRPDLDETRFYWVVNSVFGTLIFTQFQGLYAAAASAEPERHMASARKELVALLTRTIGRPKKQS